jgi:hypothetical protein
VTAIDRGFWRAGLACLVFPALAALGCGSSGNLAPVSGVVTLDGKPLANALVSFQPIAGQGGTAGVGSYGTTDAAGKYSLRTTDTDAPGAVVGNHSVVIDLKVESDDRDPRSRPPVKALPAKYNKQTELQFKVEPGGTSAANFDLKSK